MKHLRVLNWQMKYELQYYQGLLRVMLVVCRSDPPPAALLGCSPAPNSTYTLAESLNRFILLNPSLHDQGLLTDGLRVCWEAWEKLPSACITVKFKISVCRMRQLNHALLRWISYKVNVGRWGLERRRVQSGYSSSTVTQLVRVGLIWKTCDSKWPYFSSVLCQKPEEHLWALLLRPEGCSSSDRTLVLPRGEGGEVYTVDADTTDILSQ